MISLLDVVVLLSDVATYKLRKGSLGTVVELLGEGIYLVEFADLNGVTYAMPSLTDSQLLKVYHEPVAA